MNNKRRDYWDETYMRYWQQRSDESAPLSGQDRWPPGTAIFQQYFGLLGPKPGESLLEIGIGFGRLAPVFFAAGCCVYGIDISEAMIRQAQVRYAGSCKDLRLAEAEAIPYPDSFFDIIVCWAVFDALYQERALTEMSRVLKMGGRLLVSGKNDDYDDDDSAAYTAEVNARSKGHPNYFTNYERFSESLLQLGLQSRLTHFFRRRGDMEQNRFSLERLKHFYEYILIAAKTKKSETVTIAPLSSERSRTFQRIASSKET